VFTRCPGCHTVHPLNAALLAQGNGLYRCAKCNKVSNAVQNLFDSWPEAGESPSSGQSGSRQPPILGAPLELSKAPGHELSAEEAALLRAAGFEDAGSNAERGRRGWAAAAAVMAVVTLLNLAFVSGSSLLAQPSVRAALEGLGAIEAPPKPAYRNLKLLHLASSEMRGHPTLEKTLVLNATIVNRADKPQPFPGLQITLFDAHNQPLASRLFSPLEYLPQNSAADAGMPPGAYLPVIMELLDPGDDAVGFEMKFH
jgi:predicted Zn finger-like uncharacterized protein